MPQDPEGYSSMYNEVATTLLLRRQEIKGTAVALAPNTYSFTASAYLMAQLGFEMQRADHAEAILYLGLADSWSENEPTTFEQYLRYLELPACSSRERGWDVFRAVAEEWQRPFLLFLDLGDTGCSSDEDIALCQHMCRNMPRSKSGSIVFIADAEVMKWELSGRLTFEPNPDPGSSDEDEILR